MTLTDTERAALASLSAPPSIEDHLYDLGIDPADYRRALAAEGDFSDYLVAVGLQDLYLARGLHAGTELANVARQFWPLLTDGDHTD